MRDHEVVFEAGADESSKIRVSDSSAALDVLNSGNRHFSEFGKPGRHTVVLGAQAFGLSLEADGVMTQEPFAAAVGCSDARVPLEEVFALHVNDLFVARVAGNIASSSVVGSLHYASRSFPKMRAVAVVGHSSCGAVNAAVDAALNPATYLALADDLPLRGIIDAVMPAVTKAQESIVRVTGLEDVVLSGYRQDLVDVAIVSNAALTAMRLSQTIDRKVYFGIYDLPTRLIGIAGNGQGLVPAPRSPDELDDLLREVVSEAKR